ncbi:MAG: hypothetical protein ACC642_08705, partial [Pseudomonadales bacterium]
RLGRLLSITDIDLHAEEMTGEDMDIDTVVEIFNKVNSGGTKLSKGDLALAKICAGWPEARDRMKERLKGWNEHGYDFDLDWLLRNVNTVLTGEAKFLHLHDKSSEEVEDALIRAGKRIDEVLNMIAGRLGLDHDRVLFGKYAFPVMTHLLDRLDKPLEQRDADRLIFWFVQSGMWGRFSNSTESSLDKDLGLIENSTDSVSALIESLRLWHGSLLVEPEHFAGWSLGARFYPVLYMLTRMTGGRDLLNGLPLKANMLGKHSRLEVHHIFPKSLLYDEGYVRSEVNAIGNYCFLTKESNLAISNRLPAEYLPEIEARHPGVLASQLIPEDPALWDLARYPEFLEARRSLLADATNALMRELLHGDLAALGPADQVIKSVPEPMEAPIGGITSEDEERVLEELNAWAEAQGFARGEIMHELSNEATGLPEALLDLAWPTGLQEHLSEPVAVLIDETPDVLRVASRHGYRCFTTVEGFHTYVDTIGQVEAA